MYTYIYIYKYIYIIYIYIYIYLYIYIYVLDNVNISESKGLYAGVFLRIKSFTYNTLRFKDSPKNTYIAHKCNFKCVKFYMNY